MPHFHLYVYVSLSYENRLGHRKCFHSCICMCVIFSDRYWERFRQMMHMYDGLGYGPVPVMMCISDNHAPHMIQTKLQTKWKHSLLWAYDGDVVLMRVSEQHIIRRPLHCQATAVYLHTSHRLDQMPSYACARVISLCINIKIGLEYMTYCDWQVR